MTPIERIAHDVICIVKYGSPGGSAPTADVKRVAEYLQRTGLAKPKAPPPILIAHDPKKAPVIGIVGIVKYGSTGGSAPTTDVKPVIPPPPPIFKLP